MIRRALLTLILTTLAGIILGAAIGYAIGTVAPATYMSDFYGARGPESAKEVGLGYGIINGSMLGVVIGGLALLYDLGHRFLARRDPPQ